MPRIIDYDMVKQRMAERGFVSLYHNSGAFGFAEGVQPYTMGWIEAGDPSIRDSARTMVRHVKSIAELLPRAVSQLDSDAWLMPKSHWHYELHFGNRELLEAVLPAVGIDVEALRDRNDGSAVAFAPAQRELLCEAVERLRAGLAGSDFLIAFPNARTVCTIHHHTQLWWQTADRDLAEALQGIAEG